MVPEQGPVVEANLTDEVKPKTRKDRLAQHKEKVERIVHYLRHGKHRDGLTKNQQRVVRGQAKNYIFDETSNVFYNNYLYIILQSVLCSAHDHFMRCMFVSLFARQMTLDFCMYQGAVVIFK